MSATSANFFYRELADVPKELRWCDVTVRIPGEADQGSGVIAITIPG